ncbi:hypothetical protein [Mucilaginibacter sp. 10I4]|uniref:hypothetical protein n=1 Tax=Mucilaginibacter sp. 10I4 TaxID=3048580 RepID=UPI002B236DB9|nr:hypothetical protein [Mucilaginibacter sp. 10I4]MEB0261791.1 hypothetical protein [Mucilaginibacter sp. 10I4]
MKEPKPKRKTIVTKVLPLNDGTNTPVPGPGVPEKLAEGEAALYKQADNPLGDPHKI